MDNDLDVAIVGGGVIGLSCAWRLAQEGLHVAVFERHTCGSGASGDSLGVLMPPTATCREPLQLVQLQSLWGYEGFSKELEEASGIDIDYCRCGLMDSLHSDHRRYQATAEVESATAHWPARIHDPVMELLVHQQAIEFDPSVTFDPGGARFCHMTARVDVARLIEALKLACIHSGSQLYENTEVSDVWLEQQQVRGLVCGNARIPAKRVVVAAGAWTSSISPLLEKYAPIRPVKGQALLLKTDRTVVNHIIKRKKIYIVPGDNHHVQVGSTTEPEAGFDCHSTAKAIAELTDGALSLVPSLATASVVKTWAGLRPKSLSKRFFLGCVPDVRGLLVAAGHYKTGIALAPVTGKMLADLMTGRESAYDLKSFDPERLVLS